MFPAAAPHPSESAQIHLNVSFLSGLFSFHGVDTLPDLPFFLKTFSAPTGSVLLSAVLVFCTELVVRLREFNANACQLCVVRFFLSASSELINLSCIFCDSNGDVAQSHSLFCF